MCNLILFIGLSLAVPGTQLLCYHLSPKITLFTVFFFTPINFISFYQQKIYSHTVILYATLIK